MLEWYVNDESGLEQGFTIEYPPAGRGPRLLELGVEGASAQLDSQRIILRSANGRTLPLAIVVLEAGRRRRRTRT